MRRWIVQPNTYLGMTEVDCLTMEDVEWGTTGVRHSCMGRQHAVKVNTSAHSKAQVRRRGMVVSHHGSNLVRKCCP
jgi:hypothetical protein